MAGTDARGVPAPRTGRTAAGPSALGPAARRRARRPPDGPGPGTGTGSRPAPRAGAPTHPSPPGRIPDAGPEQAGVAPCPHLI